jgi:hypothetical protein
MILSDIVIKFKAVMGKRHEADRRLLTLMAHPDVTAEQLAEANKVCVAVDTKLKETVTALREKHPAGGVFVLPWNKPEFDKYDMREWTAEKFEPTVD